MTSNFFRNFWAWFAACLLFFFACYAVLFGVTGGRSLFASPSQIVELPCPGGFSPLGLSTRDVTNDAIRHHFCVSASGVVVLNGPILRDAVLDGANVLNTNATFSTSGAAGVSVQSFQLNLTTFASLGSPGNGSLRYCSDCTIANPCAGGGTGAIAKRLNGVWVCN